MGFARRVCKAKAKLAIKWNDKQEFDGRNKNDSPGETYMG
jgi:hypothetical protein